MKLISQVQQPLEKSRNSPQCVAWIILLLLITKSSQREKAGILWLLVAHPTSLETHLTALMCPAISDPSRRMLNNSLVSGVLNAHAVSFSSLFQKGYKILIAVELPLPIQMSVTGTPNTFLIQQNLLYSNQNMHYTCSGKTLKKSHIQKKQSPQYFKKI